MYVTWNKHKGKHSWKDFDMERSAFFDFEYLHCYIILRSICIVINNHLTQIKIPNDGELNLVKGWVLQDIRPLKITYIEKSQIATRTLSLLGNSSKSNMRAVSMLLITLRHRWTVPSCKTVTGNSISEINFNNRCHKLINTSSTSLEVRLDKCQ